jgi:hypothetical protein
VLLDAEREQLMKIPQKSVNVAAFICLPFVLLVLATNTDLFGYESYGECVRAERKERMDRWISPMSARDATIAAQDECHKYQEPLNRSTVTTKQPTEQEKQAKKAREEKVLNFQGPCTSAATEQATVPMSKTWTMRRSRALKMKRGMKNTSTSFANAHLERGKEPKHSITYASTARQLLKRYIQKVLIEA